MGRIRRDRGKRLTNWGRMVLLTILPLAILSTTVLGADVQITSSKIITCRGRDRITITLKGLDLKPIQEVVNGGIPFTIEYQVRIREERTLWDRTIWDGIYTRTLRLNLITKEYRIDNPTAYTKRFTEKEKFMKEALCATFPLPKGILKNKGPNTYTDVRVYRNSIHLFFPLSLIAPLIRPDSDFDTGWTRVER